jgi:hypothetical protein
LNDAISGILGAGRQEDIAADAVQQGVGPVFSGLLRKRQRFIDSRQSAFIPWLQAILQGKA